MNGYCASIQPASVDLKLGTSFRVFHNHRASAHDARDLATRAGSSLVIQAGTATSTRLRDEEQSFNRIDVDGETVTLTLQNWKDDKFESSTAQKYEREGDHWRIAETPADEHSH